MPNRLSALDVGFSLVQKSGVFLILSSPTFTFEMSFQVLTPINLVQAPKKSTSTPSMST